MSVYKHYICFHRNGYSTQDAVYWRSSQDVALCVNGKRGDLPFMAVSIANIEPFDEIVPKSSEDMKVRRCGEDDFMANYKNNFAALQSFDPRGGEYYVEEKYEASQYDFHAFLEDAHRHICLEFALESAETRFDMEIKDSLARRRFVKASGKIISERTFCQIYKAMLEFFFERETMAMHQNRMFEFARSLSGQKEPVEDIVLNPNIYFTRARDEMTKRIAEIKERLIELDDSAVARAKLRGEIRGIEFSLTALDRNI